LRIARSGRVGRVPHLYDPRLDANRFAAILPKIAVFVPSGPAEIVYKFVSTHIIQARRQIREGYRAHVEHVFEEQPD
jgi:hypothetical protein